MPTSYDPHAHRDCVTCRAIRRDWASHDRWMDNSYWRSLSGDVPTEVLLDMAIAELHGTHHDKTDHGYEAVIFAGIAVLVDHFVTRDVVPREEMREAMRRQFNDNQARVRELEQTATEAAMTRFGAQLTEAHTRLANVAALVHEKFGRKTMQRDAVRAAIDWRQGEPLPEATVRWRREFAELTGRLPSQSAGPPRPCEPLAAADDSRGMRVEPPAHQTTILQFWDDGPGDAQYQLTKFERDFPNVSFTRLGPIPPTAGELSETGLRVELSGSRAELHEVVKQLWGTDEGTDLIDTDIEAHNRY